MLCVYIKNICTIHTLAHSTFLNIKKEYISDAESFETFEGSLNTMTQYFDYL
jgi:hypothetical protein